MQLCHCGFTQETRAHACTPARIVETSPASSHRQNRLPQGHKSDSKKILFSFYHREQRPRRAKRSKGGGNAAQEGINSGPPSLQKHTELLPCSVCVCVPAYTDVRCQSRTAEYSQALPNRSVQTLNGTGQGPSRSPLHHGKATIHKVRFLYRSSP